jgi:hypothetical protein
MPATKVWDGKCTLLTSVTFWITRLGAAHQFSERLMNSGGAGPLRRPSERFTPSRQRCILNKLPLVAIRLDQGVHPTELCPELCPSSGITGRLNAKATSEN